MLTIPPIPYDLFLSPSRGLLCDYKPSDGSSFQALNVTVTLIIESSRGKSKSVGSNYNINEAVNNSPDPGTYLESRAAARGPPCSRYRGCPALVPTPLHSSVARRARDRNGEKLSSRGLSINYDCIWKYKHWNETIYL